MRISFDFDGTLWHPFGHNRTGECNPQMVEIQNLAKKYIKDGHQVFIVTKRYGGDHKDHKDMDEYQIVFTVASILGLDLKNIFFTNREMKVETLKNLKIDRHFEDDEYESKLISEQNIESIHILDKYWRDLIH